MTEVTTRRAMFAPSRSTGVDQDRTDAALRNAVWYFDQATKGQKQAYLRAINQLADNYSPHANRVRDAALAAWNASTAAAAKLYDETFDEIIRTGAVSAETTARWSALPQT
ncbi:MULTISPECIES: hypothetical protein [unclassified Bradyrhizobium]|uniref:hypothetical protein n=1 Tax=unclassified Bradyrhizobium TaxID=2631580 RepID=UPI0028E1B5A6|nr:MULTISPECIES: hypothetical protein [unclassified Bradyrhizobium]